MIVRGCMALFGRVRFKALVVVLVASASSFLGGVSAEAQVGGDEARFVDRINEVRVAAGMNPLAIKAELVDLARGWSNVMADKSPPLNRDCLLSHHSNLGELVSQSLKIGENVGCGQVGADSLHRAFMNSTLHRANILDPSYDSVGIGVVFRGNTMFVTEEFLQTSHRGAQAAASTVEAAVSVPLPVMNHALKLSLAKKLRHRSRIKVTGK